MFNIVNPFSMVVMIVAIVSAHGSGART